MGLPQMSSPDELVQRTEAPLTSWKSVADYLGRGVRTVQRWHAESGLPISRVGSGRGTILAYRTDLDSWLRNSARPVSIQASLADEQFAALKHQTEVLSEAAAKMCNLLSETNLSTIIQTFVKAAEICPTNPQAFAGIANILVIEVLFGIVPLSVVHNQAQAALTHALELQPNALEVQLASVWLNLISSRNLVEARRVLNEIAKTRPNYVLTQLGQGLVDIIDGRLDDALRHLEKASHLYPLASGVSALLCWTHYLSGAYEEAVVLARSARASGLDGVLLAATETLASLQLDISCCSESLLKNQIARFPSGTLLRGVLAYYYGKTNRNDEAENVCSAMLGESQLEVGSRAYPIALAMIGLDKKREALEWLINSVSEGDLWSLTLESDPVLAPLREDRQFQAILGRLTLSA